MPVYDYHCPRCGADAEAYNSIDARRTDAPICCGERMELAVSAPYGYVAGRWDAYKCVATGKVISTKRQRSEEMKRANLVDAEWSAGSHRKREERRNAPIKRLAAEYYKNTPAEVAALTPALPA
jgi:putative FmdB family regulatory protein